MRVRELKTTRVVTEEIDTFGTGLAINDDITVTGDQTVSGAQTVGSLTVTGATTQTGQTTNTLMPIIPTATVAATGTNQATGASVTTGFTLVTAADATKAIVLPTAVAGSVCIIKNGANATLPIFPADSDAINAIAADSAMTIAALTSVMLVAYDDTTWYSLPLLPS